MRQFSRAAAAALAVVALAVPAMAQQAGGVTQADVQRLQDNVFQAGSDVSQLRGRDTTRANQLQTELDDLRDEVTYLKVKLRKEGTVTRGEYAEVRDRIDGLRSRARGDATAAAAPAAPARTAAPATPAAPARTAPPTTAAAPPRAAGTTGTAAQVTTEIPTGMEIEARIQTRLNSGTTLVEDRFEATTLADLIINGRTVIPAGSVLRGVVTDVQPATRTNRTGRMTLSFDQMTVGGRAYPIRGTVTQAIQGEGIRGDAGRIGAGAGAGAIIGGLLGGVRGALLGVLIGGGGMVAATEGEQVDVPQGTVLRVRFDSPVQVQTAR